MSGIRVWGRQSSSNVQATMWCLGELGLDVERLDAGFIYGVVDTDAYGEMNPNRTVPTLVDGDAPPIYESGAIIRYLANQYGEDAFWPKSPVAQAQVDKWAEWSKLNIALKFTAPIFWKVVRTAPSKRDDEAIQGNIEILSRFLKIAEAQLSQYLYIAGDNLTLADIQFGHCLYRYFDIDIQRPSLPNLGAYYDRLADRAAFQDHVMIDYEELRVLD